MQGLREIEEQQNKRKQERLLKAKRKFNNIIVCEKCNVDMNYNGGEEYICPSCGFIYNTDFGKIRDYLEQNGPTPSATIASETGVSLAYIDALLRDGRVEIPSNSDVFIKCQKCGADIRFGRLCSKCSLSASKENFKGHINPSNTVKGKMYTYKEKK